MVTATPRLTAAMVEEAGAAIRPYLPATRLQEGRDARHRRVYLKLETEQPTGSFKVRGAMSNLLHQPETGAGFVTASAGNHGLGLAWAAARSERHEPVTIFVPGSVSRLPIRWECLISASQAVRRTKVVVDMKGPLV